MMTLRKSVFSALTAVVLGVASVSAQPFVASADTGTVSSNMAKSFESFDNSDELTGDARDEAVNSAVKAFERDAVLAGGETLGDVFTAKDLGNGNSFVSAKINGAADGSVIGAVVSDGGDTSTYQISLHEIDERSGTVTTYSNGEIVIDSQKVESEPNQDKPMPGTPKGMNWGELKRCLNNAGIASWAITALSVVCGVACVGTAGTGCIACLTAASGATGGTIGFCVGKAWS